MFENRNEIVSSPDPFVPWCASSPNHVQPFVMMSEEFVLLLVLSVRFARVLALW